MSMTAAILSLQLAASAAEGPDAWVEPTPAEAASASRGFRPRYPDLASAEAIRDRDLALLRAAADQMDADARLAAERALRRRLEAVRDHQRGLPAPPPDAAMDVRVRDVDARHLLDLEASTLELQLGLLEGTPAVPQAYDRVAVGDDVIVGEDEVLRDAISVGGDVIVRGRVLESAVAVMGDVVIMPGGRVDGDAVVVLGQVERAGASPPRAADAPEPSPASSPWRQATTIAASTMSLGGAGVLAVALFPAPVGRIAGVLRRRPLASAVVGVLGTLALVLASLLIAMTIVGIPVAIVGLGGLALAWLLGLVAACEAGSDAVGLPAPQGRWLALLVMSALLASSGLLPWVLQLVAVVAVTAGAGAALIARLGAAG